MNEWISLKDQCPDVMETVKMKVDIQGKEFVWEGVIWQSPRPDSLEYVNFPSPTHWMPLPEKPEL